MYHSISTDAEKNRSAYYKVCTSPERFSEQMNWLADHGYKGVTLTGGLNSLGQSSSQSDLKAVVITFDDGFVDFYAEAFPVLEKHSFQATMYLPTAYIDEKPQGFQSRLCMTWRQVTELHNLGIEFGSHTVSHSKLIECSERQVTEELHASKSTLEHRLGAEVTAFAFPYAFPQARKEFCVRFREILQSAGYKSCVTTEVGRVTAKDDALSLKRLPVNDADDISLFRAKLEGAYDWLAYPQAGLKAMKRLMKGTPEDGQGHTIRRELLP